jgi:hypothetical protein
MSRNVLVAGVGLLVFLIVAGAVYLQIVTNPRSEAVWAVSRSVAAGDALTADNVHRTSIPASGDAWDFYNGDLLAAHARASHDMTSNTIVFKKDVQNQDLALVTLSLRTPPPLAHGYLIDVYALVGSQMQTVGRHLVVDQFQGGTASVWVPAVEEPAWVTLQALNVALFAARSTGIGVPQARGQGIQDALATLGGGSTTGTVTTLPTPVPSATPKKP